MTPERVLAALGGISALVGVGAGAFGAHALRGRVAPELLATFETAVRYQVYHALALIAVALIHDRWSSAPTLWAGWLFVAGTVVFSGSLYTLTLTGARWWGAVTPVGGACFLLGWVMLVWGVVVGSR